MFDKDKNTQQIYIRAKPESVIKHSISSDGVKLPPAQRTGARRWNDRWVDQPKDKDKEKATDKGIDSWAKDDPWVSYESQKPWNTWRK